MKRRGTIVSRPPASAAMVSCSVPELLQAIEDEKAACEEKAKRILKKLQEEQQAMSNSGARRTGRCRCI